MRAYALLSIFSSITMQRSATINISHSLAVGNSRVVKSYYLVVTTLRPTRRTPTVSAVQCNATYRERLYTRWPVKKIKHSINCEQERGAIICLGNSWQSYAEERSRSVSVLDKSYLVIVRIDVVAPEGWIGTFPHKFKTNWPNSTIRRSMTEGVDRQTNRRNRKSKNCNEMFWRVCDWQNSP